MRNSPFAPMSAALFSLVAVFLVVLQMSAARCVAAEEEPKVIVKDLTSAAWNQLKAEIRKASAEKPTLVVWLVDKSGSMSVRTGRAGGTRLRLRA